MASLVAVIPSLLKGDIPCESGVIAGGRTPKRRPGNVDSCLTAMRGQSGKTESTTAFPVVENGGGKLDTKVVGL